MDKLLSRREFRGPELIKEAKASARVCRATGVSVPKIEAYGTWNYDGFDWDVSQDNAFPVFYPFGSRLIKVRTNRGDRKLAPTENSVLVFYTVVEGDLVLEDDASLSGNLINVPERQKREPKDPNAPKKKRGRKAKNGPEHPVTIP